MCTAPAKNQRLILYLHSEYPAHSDDAEDVEDGRSHNGADPDVTFSDENSCAEGKEITDYHTWQVICPQVTETSCLVQFFGNLDVLH